VSRPRILSDVPLSPVILAADIGGTHARFQLARSEAGGLVVLDEATLPVAAHDTVDEALAAFVGRTAPARIDRACLAVAGPIEGRSARLTNSRWRIDADAIATRLRIAEVVLCNDFEAAAFGLEALDPSACVTLQAPVARNDSPTGPNDRRLLIGAGTGLGVAYLLRGAKGPRVIAGEGGHVGFAPADDEQVALLDYLRPELGRVTAEHLVSGAGLARLFGFACRRRGGMPDDVRDEGAAAVARRFAAGEADAVHALRLFVSIFGAVAGDHALSVLAMGGVFVAGGIAPRYASTFADGRFIDAFRAKGAQTELMMRMPVHLVCDDRLGLRGAALRALDTPHRGR
jgi:glucokinase